MVVIRTFIIFIMITAASAASSSPTEKMAEEFSGLISAFASDLNDVLDNSRYDIETIVSNDYCKLEILKYYYYNYPLYESEDASLLEKANRVRINLNLFTGGPEVSRTPDGKIAHVLLSGFTFSDPPVLKAITTDKANDVMHLSYESLIELEDLIDWEVDSPFVGEGASSKDSDTKALFETRNDEAARILVGHLDRIVNYCKTQEILNKQR